MFNESNVNNRSRHPVRGRVIVFTTSKKVEFLLSDLTRSTPLYSVADFGPVAGFGLSFCVELVGFLTFDSNAHVRIIEVGPFEKPYYDPSAFALVEVADAHIYVLSLTFLTINTYTVGSVYLISFADGKTAYYSSPSEVQTQVLPPRTTAELLVSRYGFYLSDSNGNPF